jgi:23S rRNA (uracil1939-C5)-methyltransferase
MDGSAKTLVTPICPFFYQCGGCETQDIAYSDQLATKQAEIQRLFAPLCTKQTVIHPIQGQDSDYPVYYRNKIRFSFIKDDNGVIQPSRHAKGDSSADIAVDQCFLQSPRSDQIMAAVATFAQEKNWTLYDPKTGLGWLRHILIREGKFTGEIMLSTVSDTPEVLNERAWIAYCAEHLPWLTGLHHTQSFPNHPSKLESRCLAGSPQITEIIGDYHFVISPHAFFQTNSVMAQTLYSQACAAAGSGESLWDLYAGSATIGIYAHRHFNKVLSIEVSPHNIVDALTNCARNTVNNLTVVQGQTEQVLTSAFIKEQGIPTSIIVDPPRAGLHRSLRDILPGIIRKPEQNLVYVSCNPLTCLRDCQDLIQAGLCITDIWPIDMFPHTTHCELVIRLQRR